MRLQRAVAAWMAFVGLIVAGHAHGQGAFPNKPIRILIGSAPGGGLDQTARVISDRFSAALGQPIVIDNRPGAAGTLAAQMLKTATPDGYTINLGAIGNLAVNYSLYKNIGYHPLKDLAPVTHMVDAANVVVVHPTVPATTIKELIALAKKQRGMTYGSSGAGNAGHLAGELFNRMAGVELTHVPYKGGGPAVIAIVSGETAVLFATIPSAIQHFKSGKLVPLGVSRAKRNSALPDIPTVAESGVPGYEAIEWNGVMVPAGTPPAVINRLYQAIVKAVAIPEVKERVTGLGADLVGNTPDEFRAFVKNELATWSTVVKEVGMRID